MRAVTSHSLVCGQTPPSVQARIPHVAQIHILCEDPTGAQRQGPDHIALAVSVGEVPHRSSEPGLQDDRGRGKRRELDALVFHGQAAHEDDRLVAEGWRLMLGGLGELASVLQAVHLEGHQTVDLVYADGVPRVVVQGLAWGVGREAEFVY